MWIVSAVMTECIEVPLQILSMYWKANYFQSSHTHGVNICEGVSHDDRST